MRVSWYLKRARRMSFQELGGKTYDRILAPWIIRGLQSSQAEAYLRHEVMLPFEFMKEAKRPDLAILDVAERVRQGDRWILGLGWTPSSSWNWCADPATQEKWPIVPSYRINYRQLGTEIRLTWELNRFHDLTVLAQAFWMSQEKRYLDEIIRLLDDWVAYNPVGMGPNWVSAMEVAIRIVNLTWVARMVRHAAPHVVDRIGRQVAIHTQYVARHLSFGSSANNHLLVELMGLVVAHGYWTFSDTDDQMDEYGGRFTKELDRQTTVTGLHCEMSSHYHLLVTEAAIHVQSALKARHTKTVQLDGLVTPMRQVISALTMEDGLCQFGDDDEGQIVRFPARTMKWEQILAGAHTSPWVPLPSLMEFHPELSIQTFDGLVVVRTEAYRLIVDGAPSGLGPLYAHVHDDGGSLYLGFRGHWFLVDGGTGGYFYNMDLRKSLMEAHAHNRPTSNMEDTSALIGPFTWERVPQRFHITYDALSHEVVRMIVTSEDGVFHRTIVAEGHTIRVSDDASGRPVRVALTMPASWTWEALTPYRGIATLNACRLSLTSTAKISSRSMTIPSFGGGGKSGLTLLCDASDRIDWEVVEC